MTDDTKPPQGIVIPTWLVWIAGLTLVPIAGWVIHSEREQEATERRVEENQKNLKDLRGIVMQQMMIDKELNR